MPMLAVWRCIRVPAGTRLPLTCALMIGLSFAACDGKPWPSVHAAAHEPHEPDQQMLADSTSVTLDLPPVFRVTPVATVACDV